MPKQRVFVTQPIPDVGIKLLEKYFEVNGNTVDKILPKPELKKRIRDVDAILSLLTDHIDGDIMAAAGPHLKIIANYAVGYDNIDLASAKQRNVIITNTPGVLTEAVAEHTIALLFSVARRIVESDVYTRAGKYTHWQAKLLLGIELQSKVLGVVGLGRIGSRVAQIAKHGLGMSIIYTDVKRNGDFEKEFQAKFYRLNELLKRADIISIHVPLLPATHHLINAKSFKIMKKTAILINTSRGPVVDEQALVKALKNRQIAGAGLDVFEHEPKLTSGLKTCINAVLTPHTASATIEARNAMATIAAKNIIAVLRGHKPLNPVVV